MAITKTQGKFSKGIDDDASSTALTLDGSGNVGVGIGSSLGAKLHIDTSGAGLIVSNTSTKVRIDSDGVKFGTDTAAANALDDYEEGTWTPAYGATTGSFSSVSYQNQIGTYAKVGNIVTAHGRIDTTGSSIGTASGYLLITGFPYASASAYQSGPCAYSWGFSSVHPTAVSFQGSSSSAYLFAVDRATTTGSIVPSNVASGSSTSYLYFGITYRST